MWSDFLFLKLVHNYFINVLNHKELILSLLSLKSTLFYMGCNRVSLDHKVLTVKWFFYLWRKMFFFSHLKKLLRIKILIKFNFETCDISPFFFCQYHVRQIFTVKSNSDAILIPLLSYFICYTHYLLLNLTFIYLF